MHVNVIIMMLCVYLCAVGSMREFEVHELLPLFNHITVLFMQIYDNLTNKAVLRVTSKGTAFDFIMK